MQMTIPDNGFIKIDGNWVPITKDASIVLEGGRISLKDGGLRIKLFTINLDSAKLEPVQYIKKIIMQIELINNDYLADAESDIVNVKILANIINGINYQDNFISENYANELISEIDNHKWLEDLTRRVQHYGYKYEYKTRTVENLGGILTFPKFLIKLNGVINNSFKLNFNSVIINEYKSGQGISKHIDAKCFGNDILTISLCEDDKLIFERFGVTSSHLLKKNSVCILQDSARWNWTHCIKPKMRKDRRVSITFRNIG